MPLPVPLLYVIDHFKDPNAGTEGQLHQLIASLDRVHFTPELLVFLDSDWIRENDFSCAVTVLGCKKLASYTTWRRLYDFAKEFRSRGGTLAHVFFNDSSIICPPVFRIHGLKTIISRRDMGYWYTPFNKVLLNITRNFVDGVIVNSEAVARVTRESEGYKQGDVKVIYNGYESQVDSPLGEVDKLVALNYSGRTLIGLAANIRPIKRVEDALYALALLKDKLPKLDFVHMGDGDTALLKTLAVSLGISKRVHFLGKRSDVKACLKYLEVGLLCSESEGFSNAIIEYLQQGLPVICSDVGGNSEAIFHGKNGLLYECGNIRQLAACVEQLMESDSLRAKMAIEAKNGAGSKYTVVKMAENHMVYYHSLLTNSNQSVGGK